MTVRRAENSMRYDATIRNASTPTASAYSASEPLDRNSTAYANIYSAFAATKNPAGTAARRRQSAGSSTCSTPQRMVRANSGASTSGPAEHTTASSTRRAPKLHSNATVRSSTS